jgi:lipopolysaccharide exporter
MNRGQFSRQFLALFSGTILAQLFNLASYPILSRLYSPEDFGLFGTFIAASAIPGAIACGRFELAITTAPHAGRRAVLWLCFFIAFAVSVVSTVLISLWWWYAAVPSAVILALMLFLTVLLTGVTNATTMFLMRHDNFRFASVGVVLRTATTVLLQLGFAWVWPSPLGLIVGFCAGLAAQAAMGLIISSRSQGLGKPHTGQMRAMLRRFRGQVSVDLPGSLLAALSFNLIPFFLQFLYGIRAVGHFSVGQRIAVLPLQLFNDSLSQVFFQRAARAQEERGEFWQEFRFTLLASGLISLAMLLGMLFLARPVLAIYLGPGWDLAATILVIMAPMLAIRSVTMSLATTVFVLRRPEWLLFHNLAGVLAIAAAFGFAWATKASLTQFLLLLAVLQGAELLCFFAVIAIAARKQYIQRRSLPLGAVTD